MGSPSELYQKVDAYLASGETVAVATIVRTRGSSPREVGAKMIVRPSGGIDGTVGGGCGEGAVWRTAIDVIADHQPRMVLVDLTEPISMNTDGVCGGVMEIFVEPWSPHPVAERPVPGPDLAQATLRAVQARRPTVCATVIGRHRSVPCELGAKLLVVDGAVEGGSLGWEVLERRVLADVSEVLASGRSQVRSYVLDSGGLRPLDVAALRRGAPHGKEVEVFFEIFPPPPVLVIVGAGHVAAALAQVGKLLEFEVVVIDDRPAFANRERFPMADRVIVGDFEPTLADFPVDRNTYIVLVTRGHVHDVVSLRKVIGSPAAYIGMIGSRRRVFAVFKLLHREGVPIERIARVHAPIGLDIKTETPAEIAVSVGAELIKVRRGGGAQSLSDLVRERYLRALLKDEPDVDTVVGDEAKAGEVARLDIA